MLTRILSGGRTGVDRAALDVALALGLRAGGWCPRGRRAEEGRIPRRYRIRTLNVAGPRESKRPGVQRAAAALLRRLLQP